MESARFLQGTVILVDDHYLNHESVAHKLAEHAEFQLAATVKAGTSIRQDGRNQVLPNVRRLRQIYPETHFFIPSAEGDMSLIEGALEVRATCYLLKGDGLSPYLLDAIRTASKGGAYKENRLQSYARLTV